MHADTHAWTLTDFTDLHTYTSAHSLEPPVPLILRLSAFLYWTPEVIIP